MLVKLYIKTFLPVPNKPISMLQVAGILVACLYVSLTEELLSHLKKLSQISKPTSKCTISHATLLSRQKQHQINQSKKPLTSLDGLWKRMRAATEQFRLISARQQMVTTKMAEARVEARQAEVDRIALQRLRILKLAFGNYG